MKIKYQAHVKDLGWLDPVEDGRTAGTTGENRRLEAFKITDCSVPDINFHCFAHVSNHGWSSGNVMGEDVGSTGLGEQLEAFYIGIIGEDANKYEIFYRGHVADYGWLNWSKNGAINGTVGGGKQIEAIQIQLRDKSENWQPNVDCTDTYMNLTPKSEGSIGQKMLEVAQSQKGYISGSSSKSKFGDYFGLNGDWCDFFFIWCNRQAGGNIPLLGGYVPSLMEWAKQNGKFTQTPKVGYGVLFDFNRNGVPDHIGVYEADNGSEIINVEGNTNAGNGTGVYRRSREKKYILGYVAV